MPDLLRKRLVVMFTDIAGFTSLMEKNEAEGMEVLAYHGEAYMNLGRQIESEKVLREALVIMEEIGSRNLRAYVKSLLSKVILVSVITRNTVMEAHAMINSSLSDLDYQNTKDLSEVHAILADSYSVLKDCEFPDLISSDKCIEGYRRMISNACDTLIEIADRIDDRSLKKTFLEEIPDHREIVRKFEELDDLAGDLPDN